MRDASTNVRERMFIGQVRLLVDALVRAARCLDDVRAAAFFRAEAVRLRSGLGTEPEIEDFAEVFEREVVVMALRRREQVRADGLDEQARAPRALVARPQDRPGRRAA